MSDKELKHAEEMAKAKARKAAEKARRHRVRHEFMTAKRAAHEKSNAEYKALQKERHLKQLRKKLNLKEPKIGVKPPDPDPPPPIVPGNGTDYWREQD